MCTFRCSSVSKGRTVDLLPCDALNVDDPLLPVYLYNLSFSSLQQQQYIQDMRSLHISG